MVERYNTYCTWAHNRSTGREICPGGEHVLATDYAALEADRDEWKRRCEAILAMLAPESKALYRAALAIAEGRDNG